MFLLLLYSDEVLYSDFICLIIVFDLMSLWSGISIAIPALFWFLFGWNIFLSLHFEPMYVLQAEGVFLFAYLFCLFVFALCFLGPHLQHMEVPGLGAELELQLLADTTAAAMWNPSPVCDLQQCRILNPLSETRDQTCILMDSSQIHHPLSHSGNSPEVNLVITILLGSCFF